MAYVALYRKYRSQSFDELMGQEQVTVTLQNAIRSGRIAHAYLFYGARGCGKTSTARLLARALNCVAQDGPTPEPCGTCRLCVAIRDGACMDVIEMDAASETGIDDVREKIIENVQYAPGEARYKVYIIDEVHDLSAKAFDALLKTLEEPPPHVIFILATTEQHKVPITIRSRCSNYHFKRGTLQDLVKSVQRVVDCEGYTAEPEAVQAIARSAEGSWRDALSLLEQVLAYSDGVVTAETVHRAIGTVGTETLARVTETLATGDYAATLTLAGELIGSGKDVRQLLTALSGHLRDLMLISAGAKNAAQQELGPDRYALLLAQAAQFDPPTLLAMMSVLSAAEREIRFTNQHRWLLESALLRLMPCNLARGTGALESVASRALPRAAVPSSPRAETVTSTPSVVPRPPTTPPPVTAPEEREPEGREPEEDSLPLAAPAPAITPPVLPTQESPTRPASSSNGTQPVVSPAAPSADTRFADDVSLEVIQRAWPRILNLFKKASPSGAPWLEKGEVAELDGHTIVLAFTESFARDRFQNNEKGKTKVEQVVNQGLNSSGYKVRYILKDSSAPATPKVTAPPASMHTLLEAPETPAAASSSGAFGDFMLPANEPPPFTREQQETYETAKPPNTASPSAPPSTPAPPATSPVGSPAPEPPAENSLLADALGMFGGVVVRTEPIK